MQSMKQEITEAIQQILHLRLTEQSAIIVSGGRGLKGKEGFQFIHELAELLGGSVGATRAAVEAGWVPSDHKIGRTGKKLSQTIFITCGISGAVQHLAGIIDPRLIVAINNDADAPIFQIANCRIVGDAAEVLPIMIEIVKSELNKMFINQ